MVVPPAAEELLVFNKHPWLLDYVDANPRLLATEVAGGKGVARCPGGVWRTTTDEDCADMFDVLLAKRAEWAADHPDVRGDFSVDLLGGRWTKEHLGVEYDAFRGHAHRGEPEEFCVVWGLQKSFRCSVTTISEEISHMICTAWCSKMQFFYNIFLAEGEHVDYSDIALEGFVEEAAFTRAWDTGAAPVRERMAKIRAMRPRLA